VNILDIEEMTNLKEEADGIGLFYEYILVDKTVWKQDANQEAESNNVYTIRNTLM
jgi:hypothetical protein